MSPNWIGPAVLCIVFSGAVLGMLVGRPGAYYGATHSRCWVFRRCSAGAFDIGGPHAIPQRCAAFLRSGAPPSKPTLRHTATASFIPGGPARGMVDSSDCLRSREMAPAARLVLAWNASL